MRRLIILMGLLAGVTSVSQAAILSSFALSDPFTNETYVSITFDGVPDFYTTDAFGRQADSFQFYISYALPYKETFAPIIVRGDEIHYDSTVVIRDGLG